MSSRQVAVGILYGNNEHWDRINFSLAEAFYGRVATYDFSRAFSFPAALQHMPGSEIIKRLAEHARRLSRRWERGGNRRTRFGSLIKTNTYHANTASFVRPGMKIRLRFQYRFLKEGLNETDFPLS